MTSTQELKLKEFFAEIKKDITHEVFFSNLNKIFKGNRHKLFDLIIFLFVNNLLE